MSDTKTKNNVLPLYRDLMFKNIFGTQKHSRFTADLLESYFGLEEGSLKDLEILNSVTLNRETINAKDFILDILVKLPNNMQINMESYTKYSRNSRVKDFFYLSSLHSRQLHSGEDYSEAYPIHQLIFVKENSLEKMHNVIQDFHFTEDLKLNNWYLPDLVKTTIINLDNLGSVLYNEINERFELWRKFISARTLKEMREIAKLKPIFQEVLEEMIRFSNEDFVIERELQERLAKSEMNDAIKEGEARGIKLGEARGEARGERKGLLATAKKMLAKNFELSTISEVTGLSLTDLKALK